MGVKEGIDPRKLAEAGWGIIFADDGDPAVREALQELLALRQEQAGDNFRIYAETDGVGPNENKSRLLQRHGADPGPADPEKVPYYLLIAGDPERIPYRFQTQLDIQYAVGRIHFETLDEYENYARNVVAAETNPSRPPGRFTVFSVSNPDDLPTRLSSKYLGQSILERLGNQPEKWHVSAYFGEEARKARLAQLMGGDEKPHLLLATCHGLTFPQSDERQIRHQGALLCQDWPGPYSWQGPIPQDFYFAGDDLDSEADLSGMIAIFRASYSAGTPRLDEFARQAFRERQLVAPRSFLANLPMKMLGHPNGGALAVIGLIDRAWAFSFVWEGAEAGTQAYESTLSRILDGSPVGLATEYFNERYAELSTTLSDEVEEIEFGKRANPRDVLGMWTASDDARGHIIVGDPAVRLKTAYLVSF